MIRLFCLTMLWMTVSMAHAEHRTNWLNEAETGQILLHDRDTNRYQAALLQETDVHIEVSGPVAHVTLTQHFHNQGNAFGEGLYVFPLPENAAVHSMEMIIGERRIKGKLHEREKARRVYEQARDEGRRAGLTEQQRPNLFTTSVANIAAGDRISVEIGYSQVLKRDGKTFSLRLPMTVTPRYQPSGDKHSLDQTEGVRDDNGVPARIPASIASAINATQRMPLQAQQATLGVYIDSGLPITKIISHSHDIRTAFNGQGHNVTLTEKKVPMDQDFLLSWTLAAGAESEAAFFVETVDQAHYGLLMLMPPSPRSATRVPREQLLIIDTSGSMNGTRMQQARQSLLYALRRLDPADRFNVLAFNQQHRSLFPQPVKATTENLQHAETFVRGLQAGGGTEMLPVLDNALNMDREPEYLRQILFVTDGAVSNEHAVLQQVRSRIDGARLFSVGIGAAPNSFLMRELAAAGRGTYTYIADSSEVQQQISTLLDKIAHPVIRDTHIILPEGIKGELSTTSLPDLYLGEPLVASIKMNQIPDTVLVRGNTPQHWSSHININTKQQNKGIASLWGRERIRSLMTRISEGEPEADIRPKVVDVALTHNLVSRYTSFVAVEETAVRLKDWPLKSQQISGRIPADMPQQKQASVHYPTTSLGLQGQLYWALFLALMALLLFAGRWALNND